MKLKIQIKQSTLLKKFLNFKKQQKGGGSKILTPKQML